VNDAIREMQEGMERHGYIAEHSIATAVYLAKEMRKPLLIEGDAGVGKTEIGKVLARMLGTELIRLQCYQGLDVNTVLYEWNYQRQILHLKIAEHDGRDGRDPAALEAEIFGRDFLLERPLLRREGVADPEGKGSGRVAPLTARWRDPAACARGVTSRSRVLAALVALAGWALAGCASVPLPSPARERALRQDETVADALATRFDSLRRAQRIPGLAVVILRDTTVLLARGFGFADVERQISVTPETPFNIASVSKPMSAVVALRLAEDGVLDLDRPMRMYRGFAEFCDAVRAQGGIFFRDYGCEGDRLTMRNVLSMTANGEPGTRFWYNPPSYSWASRPMAEVTGRAFSGLVDSLVFRPAGMRHAARIHRALPLRADLAVLLALPYHIDSTGHTVQSDPPPPQGDGAAGGVIASAMDLARFDVALMDGRLLTSEWRARLWTPMRAPSGVVLPYGLGWFLADYKGRRLAWHTGLWEGQYSALYLKVLNSTAGERLTLILLANSDGLQWESRLDEAAIERSPFAIAFLAAFPERAITR
jgi:CubicO group peptidase (beta-lactamase class C family)